MSTFPAIRGVAALLASLALSACMAPGSGPGHAAHHPAEAGGPPAQGGAGMMGGGMQGGATMGAAGPGQQGGMDMGRMCAMHRDLQNAPADQRAAMMEEQMKGMSPEMRQHHMDMMRQHCR